MSTFPSDIKYGIRQLCKSSGFATVAVVSLALGIGANTAIFSLLHALVIDPFPYPESGRIVYVWNRQGWSLSDYFDIKEQMTSFTDMGVYSPERLNFGAEKPESLYAIRCTSGVLQALGMHPILGRLLNESDDQPRAEPVAVISHALWTRFFASDASVSDRRLSTSLINVFMVTTLILTLVGTYGILSYNLVQRKQEIGVRIAMGALRHHILRFAFRQVGLWIVAGLVIGLTLTAGVSLLLRSVVYDISPWNPLSLLFGLSLVGGTACLACILPARRATRIDPMNALRYE